MKRLLILSLLLLSLGSAVWAITDPGLISGKRTLAYYMMNPTGGGGPSSGLVCNLREGPKLSTEFQYTSYKSFYLITKNITKLDAIRKQGLLDLGPVRISGLYGLGLLYSPATGAGLFGDLGGVAVAKMSDELAISVPLLASIFRDGAMIAFNADLNYKPAFWGDKELFGGFRFDANITDPGSSSSMGGSFNMYILAGLRSSF